MKYERSKIVSNLFETSKSQKGGALLSAKAEKYEVYDLDALKDEFCKKYRHDEKLKSCDAYYYDQNNQIVVEFKNTHHFNLKEYYNEIEIKMTDTHMILRETLCSNKKRAELGKKLRLLMVYNDTLNCGEGIRQISSALNTMTPKRGNPARNVRLAQIFHDDAEFEQAVQETKKKYEEQFYREILFLEKKEFEETYIAGGCFDTLAEWTEMI
ncbi:MAG: hypothetical protein K2N73_17465 [Lachnospiraceae bacterium]|nr:hypothetical protein [Lachnospiraceae bacterium]